MCNALVWTCWAGGMLAFIVFTVAALAVFFGTTRLIDNTFLRP